jgi:hypothetical protein
LFCYFDDLFDGIVRLMDTADDVTGPINIGSPTEFSVRELAEIVIESPDRSKIVSRPLPADDPRRASPIAKARHVLGWTPRTLLKDALLRTIAYFEDLLNEGWRARPGRKREVGGAGIASGSMAFVGASAKYRYRWPGGPNVGRRQDIRCTKARAIGSSSKYVPTHSDTERNIFACALQ